jgi:hypothetical protein
VNLSVQARLLRPDTRRLPSGATLRHMGRPPAQDRSETFVLEADAACARLALACAYSSSDEYEAEIIRSRRAAGAYGARAPHQMYAALAAVAAVLAFAFFFI